MCWLTWRKAVIISGLMIAVLVVGIAIPAAVFLLWLMA